MKLADVVVLNEPTVFFKLKDNAYLQALTDGRRLLLLETEVTGMRLYDGVIILDLDLTTSEYMGLASVSILTKLGTTVVDNSAIRCVLENDDYYG